jgi:hypothetical protein
VRICAYLTLLHLWLWQLKLEDFAWLKAILQAAKGNSLPFGDVGIAAIGDVFQLPAIGGASVYAGAASFEARPDERPDEAWERIVRGVNPTGRKHGSTLKTVCVPSLAPYAPLCLYVLLCLTHSHWS